jgi:VWFA-related protein
MILSPDYRRKKSLPQPKQPKPAKRKRKSNLVVAFALLWTPAAFAQNRTQFLDVRVTDSEGRAVADLTAADFEISLDGRPQQIVDCSYITGPSPTPAAPLLLRPAAGVEKRRMVLVVDDLNLSARGADQVRQVLRRYIDQQMQPGDETVVIRTSSGSGAQQQFTDDSIHLRDAIDHIQPRHLAGPGPDAPFAIGTMGTLDLTFEGLRALPGRKSVVLFTEATPAITSAVGSLLEKANRAFAVFYAINPAGTDTMFQEAAPSAIAPRSVAPLMATGPTELPNSPLQALAKATGGLVLDRGGVASGFARVLEDRQSYYLLRYSRDFAIFRPGTGEQLVSHIAVKTVRDGLTIRTRDFRMTTFCAPRPPIRTNAWWKRSSRRSHPAAFVSGSILFSCTAPGKVPS